MHYMLLYDYVADVAERRGPHRPQHLALLEALHAKGQVLFAGAWNDPLDGAAIVFHADDRSAVEAFVRADPYVTNGLVSAWRIREWRLAVGGT